MDLRKTFTLTAVPQECWAEIVLENTYFLDFSHFIHVALNVDFVIEVIRVNHRLTRMRGGCEMALELPQDGTAIAAVAAVPNPGSGGSVTVNGVAAERTPSAKTGGAVFQSEDEGYCYFQIENGGVYQVSSQRW